MRSPRLLPILALLLAPSVGAQATAPPPSPSDPKNFSWVEEGVLAIGGGGLTKGQVDWLRAQGFLAIADFRAEHKDPADDIRGLGMEFLDLPVEHAVDINVTQLQQFVAWADAQKAAGRPMYVHCTNGWHRAAAFVIAYEMHKDGYSYDEALKRAMERRPGTVGRAPLAGLQYDALLRGEEQLNVLLLSPANRPENGSEMPVTVEVLAGGQPIAGAKVKVWSEESRLRLEGASDAAGRFTFTYKAPANHSMDHLYARASAPGYRDGADNVELFYFMPIDADGPVSVNATRTDAGIYVQVRGETGSRVPARVVASAHNWSAFDVSATGQVMLPLPPEGTELRIRAESWGALPSETLLAPPAPPEPVAPPTPVETPPLAQPPKEEPVVQPPEPAAPSEEPAAPQPPAAPVATAPDARTWRWALPAAGVALAGAGIYLASRSRWGSGSR